MGNDSLVLEALYHEVIYMVLTSPEITSEESAWMDRAPVKSDLSVPKAVSSGDSQGAEFDESPADLQAISHRNHPYSESVRLAMRQAEAQEYGCRTIYLLKWASAQMRSGNESLSGELSRYHKSTSPRLG